MTSKGTTSVCAGVAGQVSSVEQKGRCRKAVESEVAHASEGKLQRWPCRGHVNKQNGLLTLATVILKQPEKAVPALFLG